jgi:hypothetical protein
LYLTPLSAIFHFLEEEQEQEQKILENNKCNFLFAKYDFLISYVELKCHV